MTPKLRLDRVRHEFPARSAGRGRRSTGRVTALEDVTLDIRAGEFLVLVGPSGCGKSTLLDLLGGLARPTSGQILLDGVPVTGPGLDRGLVFQQYALLPWRTAQGNVEFGLEARGVGRRQRAQLARDYLELVGLAGFAERYPHELSGGMQQRLGVARVLANEPAVMLMDEPFASIDAQTRRRLQEDLTRIFQERRPTVFFVTHDVDEAVFLSDRVVVLTGRPSTVQEIVEVDLPRPRAWRTTGELPRFRALCNRITDLLVGDEADAVADPA